jgi:hypothetical protein
MEIRQRLYDEVRPHEPDKLPAAFTPGFELLQRREVRRHLRRIPGTVPR